MVQGFKTERGPPDVARMCEMVCSIVGAVREGNSGSPQEWAAALRRIDYTYSDRGDVGHGFGRHPPHPNDFWNFLVQCESIRPIQNTGWGGQGGGRSDREGGYGGGYDRDDSGGGGFRGSSYGGDRGRSDVCFDFQKGICRRGDNCRFSHSGGVNQGVRRGRDEFGDDGFRGSSYGGDRGRSDVCFDFQKGTCRRGDNCRFSHGGGGNQGVRRGRDEFGGGGRENQRPRHNGTMAASPDELERNTEQSIQLKRNAFMLEPRPDVVLYQYRVEFAMKSDTEFVSSDDLQTGSGEYQVLRERLLNKALGSIDAKKARGTLRNRSSTINFDGMTFMSRSSKEELDGKAKCDVDLDGIIVEWETRKKDPREEDDSDDEKQADAQADTLIYRVQFKLVREISDIVNIKMEEESVQVQTSWVRAFISKEKYISTLEPKCFVLKSDLEKVNQKLDTRGSGRGVPTIDLLATRDSPPLVLFRGWQVTVGTNRDGKHVEVSLKNIYLQQQSIYDWMKGLGFKIGASDDERTQTRIAGEIEKKHVVTVYNGLKYRIESIEWGVTGGSDVPLNMNARMKKKDTDDKTQPSSYTYRDYYRITYGKTIGADEPMLKALVKKRLRDGTVENRDVLLPPSLCHKLGLTQDQDEDSFMRREMVNKCTLTPSDQLAFVQSFVDELADAMNQSEESPLKLSKSPILGSGVTLEKPVITFQDETRYLPDRNNTWRNAVRDKSLVAKNEDPIAMKNWCILFEDRYGHDVDIFVQEMLRVARPMSVRFDDPVKIGVGGTRVEDFIYAYQDAAKRQRGFEFCLVVLPKSAASFYEQIKGELTFGECCCPSQCIQAKQTLQGKSGRPDLSKVTAVVLQMAGPKHSNSIWHVDHVEEISEALCSQGGNKHMMVMAYDVMSSIACLCYTTDKKMAKTHAVLANLEGGAEGRNPVADLAEDALTKFHGCNGVWPAGVLLYRVGVSGSQSSRMADDADEFCERIVQFYTDKGEPHPGIEICQVNLSGAKLMDGRNGNAPPGSMLDEDEKKTILLAHGSRPSATACPLRLIRVTPAAYCDNNETWEKVKRITQKNCSMYENYSGTIKLPALAHKAKICADKLSRWWGRYRSGKDSWPEVYARLTPFLDRPFYV